MSGPWLFCLLYSTVLCYTSIDLDTTVIEFPVQVDYLAPFGCTGTTTCQDSASLNKLSVAVLGLSESCYLERTILNINKKLAVSDICKLDGSVTSGYESSTILLNSAFDHLAKAAVFLLKKWSWSNIAVISSSTEPTSFMSLIRSTFLEELSQAKMDVLFDSRIDPGLPAEKMIERVREESAKARIFLIVDLSKNAMLFKKYLYSLASLNKIQSGDYFVIGFLPYEMNFEWMDSGNATIINHFGYGEVPSAYNISESDIATVYRNLLILSDAPPPSTFNSTWAKFKRDVQSAESAKVYCPPYCGKTKTTVSPRWDRIKVTYDSLQYLADGANDALSKGVDFRVGENFYEYLLSREIKSIAGVTEFVDGNGQVSGAMQVYTFFTDLKEGQYSMWPVARLSPTSMTNSTWKLDSYLDAFTVNFINGTVPLDVPACGFHEEKCLQTGGSTFVIIMSIILTCLICVVIAAFFFRRQYLFLRKLNSLSFLIDRSEIILKKHVNLLSQRSLRSLASGTGESFMESQVLHVGNFVLDDYQTSRTVSNIGSNIGSQLASQLRDVDSIQVDERWKRLSDFAVGLYQGRNVGLKRIFKTNVEHGSLNKEEIFQLQDIRHNNLIGFLGITMQSPDVFLVLELAQRGSLKDILDNEDMPLDDFFNNQMAKDIVAGLEYLHNSPIGCHGRLKSSNCLIDSRWMVRLSSFGLRDLRDDEEQMTGDVQIGRDKLWTSPELLRWSTGLSQCDPLLVQKADVYSLSIVLYELFGRVGPWGEEPMEPQEIVNRVKHFSAEKKLFRPDVAVLKDAPEIIRDTVISSWAEEPLQRPWINQIKKKLRPLNFGQKRTIMDHMVALVTQYTTKLENDIAEHNAELALEKEKTDQLLRMMLPDQIVDSLKIGNHVTAESFKSVTIFFSDCPGFVEMSATSQPMEMIQFLNDLYTCFDNIINQFDVYKVETIADAYMVASGLPLPNGNHHAGEIASLGLALLKSIESFKIRHRKDEKVKLRIGINSGPCVAGVIGIKMPRYCLFGDTVNTASRMESNGIPLRINTSQSSKDILEELGGYVIEERGLVEMKGKGMQKTYFVKSSDENHRRVRILKDRVRYASLKKAQVSDPQPFLR